MRTKISSDRLPVSSVKESWRWETAPKERTGGESSCSGPMLSMSWLPHASLGGPSPGDAFPSPTPNMPTDWTILGKRAGSHEISGADPSCCCCPLSSVYQGRLSREGSLGTGSTGGESRRCQDRNNHRVTEKHKRHFCDASSDRCQGY